MAGDPEWRAAQGVCFRRLLTATGFLVSALSQPMALLVAGSTMDVSSANGECGLAIDFLDSTTTALLAAAPLDFEVPRV